MLEQFLYLSKWSDWLWWCECPSMENIDYYD